MTAQKKTTSKKRPIAIEDLLTLKFVKGGSISPDGKHFAFSAQTVKKDKKGYDSHLYVAATDGSSVRQFTYGKRSDSSPVFSPNGSIIAFQGKRGNHPGIHLIPVDGGEARTLVEKNGSFADLSFSPDGKTILCAFRENDPPPGEEKKTKPEAVADDDKAPKHEEPVYRHITRLFYRLDEQGFRPKDGYHIWTFDVETGKGTQLTKGKRDEMSPSFSPDGKWIVYVSNVRPDPDLEMEFNDIFVMSASGAKPFKVDTPRGFTIRPRFSPDGKSIAYLGHDETKDPWYEPARVWVVPVRGGKARCLCPDFDHNAFDETISDTGGGFFDLPPTWSPDGKQIHFISSGDGSSWLMRVDVKGGTPERITPEKIHIQSISLDASGKYAAGVVSTVDAPPEAYSFDLKTGKPRQISIFNKDWASGLDIQKPERVTYSSKSNAKVEAWILKPPGFKSGKKYPAIVEVHGGPMTQYGYSFFHELQLLAARGYVVFYGNPRGSAGYGRAWAEAIKHDWGGADWDDVSAGTDYLATLPYVDEKRIGITGGSYGGYMTNWAVGHTTRYKAAVTQRSVVDMVPFFGSSDVGYMFHYEMGGYPWSNLEGYRRQSPLTYVENIRTPLLIIHSEKDLRCNIEQAENLFATLKVLKRTVELVRFPEEPHGLSRTGRPDRRVARLEKILDWFKRYM